MDYELDIALIGRKTSIKLHSNQFSEDEMCVICAMDAPFDANQMMTLNWELEAIRWILPETGSGWLPVFCEVIAPRLEQWQAFQLNTAKSGGCRARKRLLSRLSAA